MAEQIKILYAGEHRDDAALVELALQRDFPRLRLATATDAAGFALALGAEGFDLAILDHQMSWADGLDLLAPIRQRHPSIPIVMLAGNASIDAATEGMRRGLSHYLDRSPRNLMRLPHVVRELLRGGVAAEAAPGSPLLEQSGFAIARCNLDGRLLEANAAFARIVGLALPPTAEWPNLYELCANSADCGEILRAIRSGGKIREALLEFRPAAAPSVQVRLASIVPSGSGATRTVQLLMEDVTDRVHLERELRERVQNLEAANKDLQQFTSMASHELKEPLRTLERYSKILGEEAGSRLTGAGAESLDFIRESTQRMQQLVEDLLAYSRILARAQTVEMADCQSLLRQALANLRAPIEENDARITSDPLPTLSIDPWQIVSLFQNLISNAIKFRSEKSPLIHVSAKRAGAEWVFTVRDNGIGIPAAEQERIFEIFQRLHSKDEIPGSGVGLAICRKIVERHGGRIRVESEAGRGAAFTFTLPASDAATQEERQGALSVS